MNKDGFHFTFLARLLSRGLGATEDLWYRVEEWWSERPCLDAEFRGRTRPGTITYNVTYQAFAGNVLHHVHKIYLYAQISKNLAK